MSYSSSANIGDSPHKRFRKEAPRLRSSAFTLKQPLDTKQENKNQKPNTQKKEK